MPTATEVLDILQAEYGIHRIPRESGESNPNEGHAIAVHALQCQWVFFAPFTDRLIVLDRVVTPYEPVELPASNAVTLRDVAIVHADILSAVDGIYLTPATDGAYSVGAKQSFGVFAESKVDSIAREIFAWIGQAIAAVHELSEARSSMRTAPRRAEYDTDAVEEGDTESARYNVEIFGKWLWQAVESFDALAEMTYEEALAEAYAWDEDEMSRAEMLAAAHDREAEDAAE